MTKPLNAFTRKPVVDPQWIAAQVRSERAKPGGRRRSAMSTERTTSKTITPREKGRWL